MLLILWGLWETSHSTAPPRSLDYWRCLDLARCVLLPIVFGLHVQGYTRHDATRILGVLLVLLVYARWIYFLRVFRQLGAMVAMLDKVGQWILEALELLQRANGHCG